jgi:hypothetical protein
MRTSLTKTTAAVLGGAAALIAALPLAAANADELMVLDAGQLDGVTAAAAAGVSLIGGTTAFGTLFSQSTLNFQGQSVSSPAFSSASGSITSFGLGIGGTGANTPVANGDTQLAGITGDRTYVYDFNRSGSGLGYAYDFDATYAFAVSSEFPI